MCLATCGEAPDAPPLDHLIAGKLLANEVVVGLVGVEGIDDVVAVSPLSLGKDEAIGVHVEAHRVSVADDIEPMACPALAETR